MKLSPSDRAWFDKVLRAIAAAEAGVGRLAVVSDDLPMLDREAVTRLRALGVGVLALAGDGGRATGRMLALGVHATVPADAPVGDVVAAVLALADAGDSPRAGDAGTGGAVRSMTVLTMSTDVPPPVSVTRAVTV